MAQWPDSSTVSTQPRIQTRVDVASTRVRKTWNSATKPKGERPGAESSGVSCVGVCEAWGANSWSCGHWLITAEDWTWKVRIRGCDMDLYFIAHYKCSGTSAVFVLLTRSKFMYTFYGGRSFHMFCCAAESADSLAFGRRSTSRSCLSAYARGVFFYKFQSPCCHPTLHANYGCRSLATQGANNPCRNGIAEKR